MTTNLGFERMSLVSVGCCSFKVSCTAYDKMTLVLYKNRSGVIF
jgi:hypothetical protein